MERKINEDALGVGSAGKSNNPDVWFGDHVVRDESFTEGNCGKVEDVGERPRGKEKDAAWRLEVRAGPAREMKTKARDWTGWIVWPRDFSLGRELKRVVDTMSVDLCNVLLLE